MTEEEWLTARSPEQLLLWLGAKTKRRRGVRKNGLFAAACGERVKSFMTEEVTLRGLEIAEGMAEGLFGEPDVDTYLAAFQAAPRPNVAGPHSMAWNVPFYAVHVTLPHRTGQSSEKQTVAVCKTCAGVYYSTSDMPRAIEEEAAQADLLRDVVGNPFRPVTANAAWITYDVIALARQMYESRDFSTMPILADALQDAGCENAEVLDHCRGEGSHVRGCWLIDLLLRKE